MDTGDGAKLARVTYLPGVTPSPESALPGTADSPTVPDFASFFGEGSDSDSGGAESRRGESSAAGSRSGGLCDERAPGESSDMSSTRREVRAENVSMHALTRRGMSRWELERILHSREIDQEVVEAELDRLEGVGLLDDAALAETFVRTQHDRKGLGRGAITAELRRRHIDQEHIDAALEQVDDDDEQTRATELAIKRAGQLSSYDLETAKRRLHGFLSRKGYSSPVVRAAVDEALSARSSGVRFR